jgi:hypothetical protein
MVFPRARISARLLGREPVSIAAGSLDKPQHLKIAVHIFASETGYYYEIDTSVPYCKESSTMSRCPRRLRARWAGFCKTDACRARYFFFTCSAPHLSLYASHLRRSGRSFWRLRLWREEYVRELELRFSLPGVSGRTALCGGAR